MCVDKYKCILLMLTVSSQLLLFYINLFKFDCEINTFAYVNRLGIPFLQSLMLLSNKGKVSCWRKQQDCLIGQAYTLQASSEITLYR